MNLSEDLSRRWTTVLPGMYLFATPWIFGGSEYSAASANAWLVGAFLIVAVRRTLTLFGPQTAEVVKAGVGAWLLASPFVLGFVGSSAAWNAWLVGALTIAFVDLPTAAFALVTLAVCLRRTQVRLRVRRISPQKILCCPAPEEPPGPGRLCWQIVERSHQIRDALRRDPPEPQIEACILGHAACMHDLTLLLELIAVQRRKSGPVRRRRLGLLRWAATRSVHRAGEAFPRAVGTSQRSGPR